MGRFGAVERLAAVVWCACCALTVAGCVGVTGTSPSSRIAPLQITTSSLPNGTASKAYGATLAATGGTLPYTWEFASGTLAPGLSLSVSAGTISGTPTQSGTFSFAVQVKDSSALAATANLSIEIAPATLQIALSTLPNGTVSQAYSASVAATGGTPPYNWSLSSGALPAGLALGASTGTISGTPTQSGTFSFTIAVKDSAAQNASANFTVQIANSAPALRITTSSLANGTVAQAYSATVVATGGASPYTWSVSSGALSAGLALGASTGTISGTPTQPGTFGFTVQVRESGGQSATANLSVQIASAPPATLQITTSSLPNGTVTQAYSATMGATGGTSAYTWAVSSGALPAGLNLAASTGTIFGTPTQAGTSSFTMQVKDSGGQTAKANLSIQVVPMPLQIVTSSLANATAGQSYGAQLAAGGGTAPYKWTIGAGSLPSGLSLSSSGLISGSAGTAGAYSFSVQVTDANAQTASKSYTLTVSAATSVSCDLYVSPTGSDANNGTQAAPWQTVQHAFSTVQPGQTVCLRAGTYAMVTGGTYSQTLNVSGTATQRIVVTNYPGEVAIIHGSTRVNGAYATFQGTPATAPGLIFEGPTGPGTNLDLIDVMNTHDVTFDHVEIRYGNYHAGLYQYGGYNIKVLGAYIHDNGVAGVNLDHGIYWDATIGGGNLIANCVIEHNASQGIALYSSSDPTQPQQVSVEENTLINNGHYGIDLWGIGDTVVNNILAGNGTVFNSQQMGVETGTNHIIDSNLVWSGNTSLQGIYNATGQSVTHTLIADPLFVDPANHNYHLLIGSPAVGAGNLSDAQPVDKDNASRAPGPDLGAYEYVP
jgi:Putative Ig domain/Right handed beta helix region